MEECGKYCVNGRQLFYRLSLSPSVVLQQYGTQKYKIQKTQKYEIQKTQKYKSYRIEECDKYCENGRQLFYRSLSLCLPNLVSAEVLEQYGTQKYEIQRILKDRI